MLHPNFLQALQANNDEAFRVLLKQETTTGIYSLQMFTDQFCVQLMEEVDCFESSGLPALRPNR